MYHPNGRYTRYSIYALAALTYAHHPMNVTGGFAAFDVQGAYTAIASLLLLLLCVLGAMPSELAASMSSYPPKRLSTSAAIAM
eukprot:11707-Heterococcus_DN1.PRE.2